MCSRTAQPVPWQTIKPTFTLHSDGMFACLRSCIACSVRTRRLLRLPIAETTFQVSDRTWTVSSNATPGATPRGVSSQAHEGEEDVLEPATSVVVGA